ncbi:MAG: hypothetical protein KGL25_01150 [Gammaproteobacteria bacterium]|nr:hypothetical protein [Gammaproteobacteria bacterium]MDE2249998.1 hypothetical protein [Gammaproteobacteria bacterium]
METQNIALLIPILGIVMGIGIGMLALFLDYRKKQEMFAMHHKERMAAIEKGMEVPPLPPEFFQDGRRRRPALHSDFLRRGLVLLFIGAAICIALYNNQRDAYLWGLVPAGIGLAQLLYYFLARPKTPEG